jgi:large subunit ribosomal protein L28
MANRCDVCGKGPASGNNVSHANNRTKRTFKPNLHKMRAIVDGTVRRIKVCSRCLKAGKVQRAVS